MSTGVFVSLSGWGSWAADLQRREKRQLRDPLSPLDVVRDEHGHRLRVEHEVEHRALFRRQPRGKRRRREVDRLEVLRRRRVRQAGSDLVRWDIV